MTASYTVDFDQQALHKALVGPNGTLTSFLESFGRQTVAQAVTNVTRLGLVKTGNLRRSIHTEPIEHKGPFTASIDVVADAEYASFVHNPTRAYTVRPVGKKALRFFAQGKPVFAMHANIPARPGKPFLSDACEAVAARMLT